MKKNEKVRQMTVLGFNMINIIFGTCLLYLTYCRTESDKKDVTCSTEP